MEDFLALVGGLGAGSSEGATGGSAIAVFPPRSWIECAAFEAALVYGRQLVEFLGFGIDADQFPPVLRERIRYHRYERDGVANTDEVKITDLGGDFLLRSALTKEEQSILAEFCFGTSKATAHPTEGSNPKLNHNNGEIFIQGCKLIIKLVNENLAKIPR